MHDDNKPGDDKTAVHPVPANADHDGKKSSQDKTLERLPGASPPSDNEAEGEGDGTLEKDKAE